MTLAEAQRLLAAHLEARAAGQMKQAAFAAAVTQLKVQDDTGRWWAPSPATGAWRPRKAGRLAVRRTS